jgi:hypothetical protein
MSVSGQKIQHNKQPLHFSASSFGHWLRHAPVSPATPSVGIDTGCRISLVLLTLFVVPALSAVFMLRFPLSL